MKGKLLTTAGHKLCVSCFNWNCWHKKGKPCDIDGCECQLGNNDS